MRWIIDNWENLLPFPWAHAALVFVAVLCGGLVGLERERKQKAVGFRTLALVSLGSTVFTMLGASLQHVTPIAAQVVTGIGFLGAGVILRGPFGITGLTSAATIWAMAAVGMTVGFGYAGAGLALSLFMVAAMFVISVCEQRYIGPCRYRWVVLTLHPAGGKTLVKIEEVLDEYRFPRVDIDPLPDETVTVDGPGRAQLRLRYCGVHRHHHEFLAFLANMPEIEGMHREPLDAPAPVRRR